MSYNDLSSVNQNIINRRTLQNVQENNNVKVQNPISSEVKKIDKKKLAVGVAAGIGITALVVGGILYNKKINSKAVKELAEHIDFKEAKSLDEAIEFGKQCLGIRKYKGFKETDLDVVNWVNEGLVNVNNKAKGKAIMPKAVKYSNKLKDADASINGFGTLAISKDYVKNIKSFVKEFISNSKLPAECPERFGEEALSKLSFTNAKRYLMKIGVTSPKYIVESLTDAWKNGPVTIGTFDTIYHEMGHLQHNHSIGSDLFYQLASYDLSKTELSEKGKKLWDLFNKSKDTTIKVSQYSQTTPGEFVAEVFKGLCSGKKFDDSVMDLYKEFGGVMI